MKQIAFIVFIWIILTEVSFAFGVLIILIASAGWAGSLYLWPFGPCMKCGGSGMNRGSNRKKKFGQCRRCTGTGRRIRIGARTVHRGRVALADRKKKGK